MRLCWLVVVCVACGGKNPGHPADAQVGDGPSVDATTDGSPDAALQAPTTANGAITLEVGSSIASNLTATDPQNAPLTYSIVTQPAYGTVTLDAATGAYTYQATTLTATTDSFTFQVNNGQHDAPTPGTIAVTIQPVLFTGYWALTNVTDNGAMCGDSSFRFGHATPSGTDPGMFAVSQRVVSCGTTTWTFTADQETINSSNVTDAVVTSSRSTYVSGCGTVTDQFRLERTLTGFLYTETTNTPCYGIGMHTITATATRTEAAYLFATSLAFGNRYQGDPATGAITLRNVGRPAATTLSATAPAAPFAYEGGSYPGTTGTCGTQLAGLSSCTLSITMDTTSNVANATSTITSSYMDGVATQSASSALSGTVEPHVTNVTAVAVGYRFQCVIAGGAVTCWGSGMTGVTVPTLVNPRAIAAGDYHACALDDTGLHCWGSNSSGQTTVPTLSNPVAVTAGSAHTCAIDDTGVHCWGSNTSGQCTVPALSSPTAITAGDAHTCALDSTGVHCWGSNTYGQCTVPALSSPTQVSAGVQHTCAVDAAGAHCWGSDFFGRVTLPALTSPTYVSAGGLQSCALANSAVTCWGFFSTSTPMLTSPSALDSGYDYTCAVAQGNLSCWGSMTYP